MELTGKVCVVCGEAEAPRNPLGDDGFYDDVFIHLRCYNSNAANAWRAGRRAADPAYGRYETWMTPRVPIVCPHCHADLEMSPKAVGMGAGSWAVHCGACHRTGSDSFSGYGQSRVGYGMIVSIRGDFVRSRRLGTVEARVVELARAFDHFINRAPCECGGRFSLAAKPRCLRCDGVVIDTWFQVLDEPLSEERRKRLEALMRGEV